MFDLKWEDLEPEKLFFFIIMAAVPGFLLGYGFALRKVKKDNFILKRFDKTKRKLIILDGVIFLIITGTLFWSFYKEIPYSWMLWSLPFTVLSGAITFYYAEKLFKADIEFEFTKDLISKKIPKKNLEKEMKKTELELANYDRIPLGVSYVNHEMISLSINSRKKHMLISGRNGMGKTSLALSMLRHDLFWNRPIVFIDPKAEQEDVDTAKYFAKKYDREKSMRYFSTVHQKKSCFIDPLRLGNPSFLANKIIFMLDLNHPHWGSLATSLMTVIFETFELIKEKPTLDRLEEIFISKEAMIEFFNRVNTLPLTPEIERLQLKINRFQKIKDEAFDGLQAGIMELNNKSIKNVLNPSSKKREVAVDTCIENGLFLYIDLNIEGDRISKMIGRLILKDLEYVADKLQHKKLKMKSSYAGIYIDEFDTFADENFNNFFKRARSSGIAMTLLFQSRANIDKINPYLYSQIEQNAETKIDFLSSNPDDIDTISYRAGSLKVLESSQQIDQTKIKNTTGLGSQHKANVFELDPNLTRRLGTGQFILYTQEQNSDESGVGGTNILDIGVAWNSKKYSKDMKNKNQVKAEYRYSHNIDPPEFRPFTEEEKRLLSLNFRDWHRILTYAEIEKIKDLHFEMEAYREKHNLIKI